eukprot:TRINITY_DN7369_c0_g1_i2.p1 TRINITY_DN7369_c0_g1~~TRINITY_DN7369_c0_g1_i2.p1  ORF type:complete len:177 (+),score=23.57 TRINITY_DN7369_c0_g1_i2:78-608(+)
MSGNVALNQNRAAADAARASQCGQFNSGVLLHNWYEDRFAPKAGALADVYPMPPTTYQAEYKQKSEPWRAMLRTGDLGKDILFGQGSLEQTNTMPSVTFHKYEKKKQEWTEMRDPETAGQLVSTKKAVDTHVLKELQSSAASSSKRSLDSTGTSFSRNSTFSKSKLRDHEGLGLRD